MHGNKWAGPGRGQPASASRRGVGGLLARINPFAEPFHNLALDPPYSRPWPVPEAHALWESVGGFKPLDMLRAIEHQLLELTL